MVILAADRHMTDRYFMRRICHTTATVIVPSIVVIGTFVGWALLLLSRDLIVVDKYLTYPSLSWLDEHAITDWRPLNRSELDNVKLAEVTEDVMVRDVFFEMFFTTYYATYRVAPDGSPRPRPISVSM